MIDIVRLAARLGVEFAFPTQTLFMSKTPPMGDPPPLPEKAAVDKALEQGRTEARSVTEGELGGADVIPPPVSFKLSEKENRGEGDDGGEGE